ncbi:MAG: YiiX/YebB-like N1pC/P60 family cysteine hydrolase [Cycloclasticus sp.]|nr:YiiX/YebB-like N1pC/P60 family cysteine hydrolase [Cycloclasticus sp.]
MDKQDGIFDRVLKRIGLSIANYLSQPVSQYTHFSLENTDSLKSHLLPGDILLVEGRQRISTAIKYLTQSTWSHAAIYIGDIKDSKTGITLHHQLIEADLVDGVVAVSVDKYCDVNTRICRPIGLNESDQRTVVDYMLKSLGKTYDQRNIVDLIRYLLPTPPIPSNYRRELLRLGSGDPTRAICSTLIAQAYQSIQYPILPVVKQRGDYKKLLFQLRHHSLFVPRDFDISPFFNIIKPALFTHFDRRKIQWDMKENPVKPS